jgi:organic hydroperoxide reductase OsmC/OhrA
MGPLHTYDVTVTWTGDDGRGTANYRSYRRDHVVAADGPPDLVGSSDPTFRGDAARWNPEQLLVAALAQCHMLWYLHLCATNGVVVTGYVDRAHGTMRTHRDGSGEFTSVVLRPEVTVADPAMVAEAERLHAEAPNLCFIARSVNFPVDHEPKVTAG